MVKQNKSSVGKENHGVKMTESTGHSDFQVHKSWLCFVSIIPLYSYHKHPFLLYWPREISVSDMQHADLTWGSLLFSRSGGKKWACTLGPLIEIFMLLPNINAKKSLYFPWLPKSVRHGVRRAEQGWQGTCPHGTHSLVRLTQSQVQILPVSGTSWVKSPLLTWEVGSTLWTWCED